MLGWFADRWAARAAFVGAAAGVLVGTVANDSGSVLLVIGTVYLAVTTGFFWAFANGRRYGRPNRYHRRVRVAIVTPYSWAYPGGVNGHVDALARELQSRGHELRVLAPDDPPGRLTGLLHRAQPEPAERPDYVVPLSRTKAFGANGSVSNIGIFPDGVTNMRRELRAFAPDVVHVHEPPAGPISWDACSYPGAPVVATFHAYSTKPLLNHVATLAGMRRKLNQLAGRIAVSEAAAWTGRRWFGGHYDVVPNGVDVDAAPTGPKSPSDSLRLIFVGRPEERKGLPVLLTAFEALVEHHDAELVVIGAEASEVERYVTEDETLGRIQALGRVSGAELWRRLAEADLLCAPSLAGESFGMVLTEAFAAGTPVLASNIAGYADVVTDGHDGVLVPPADPQRLAEALQRLQPRARPARPRWRAPRASRRSATRGRGSRRRSRASTSAPSRVPEPARRRERAARRVGLVPPTVGRPCRAQRLPSLDPEPPRARERHRTARRVGARRRGDRRTRLTFIAARRIGVDQVVASIVRSDISWVLIATGLMMASMFLRASAWFSIAKAALPAQSPAAARRRLGDDGRGPDVGDAARAPRRARPSDGPRSAHGPDARDAARCCSGPWSPSRSSTSSRSCCSA